MSSPANPHRAALSNSVQLVETATTPKNPDPKSEILIAYFRSGWAFLIPYLAAYLLYAWLKWPVNPATSGEGLVKGMSESVEALNSQLSTLSSQRSSVPSLLHVYWFLHGQHLILGTIALRAWWSKPSRSTLDTQLSTTASPSLRDRVWPLIPWLCLALIFWIPGVYLEWPSDPWEHLRRVNEWHILGQVTTHSIWEKSSYFLPYSLTGFTTGLAQLSWLNGYYTSVCLLLGWQYYRLARSVGLSERASFVSVLLNALTFGNSIFSFYRYYGLSSSILAQIGAVALTRIVLDAVQEKLAAGEPGAAERKPKAWSLLSTFLAPSGPSVSRHPSLSRLLRSAFSLLLLLPLIAFNHTQGLGIAGLSVLAVLIWRAIEWRRQSLLWISGAALLLSAATVLWWPRHPSVDGFYRAAGWLNSWYGFNFSWKSPTTFRSLDILGMYGVLNLLAGLILLRRNHAVGWLTVGPLLALMLPLFAVPFASVLQTSGSGLHTFHRMFFAIPSGLGLVCLLDRVSIFPPALSTRAIRKQGALAAAGLLAFGLLVVGSSRPYNNRLWHVLSETPRDLALRPLLKAVRADAPYLHETWEYRLFTNPPGTFVLSVIDPALLEFCQRTIGQSVAPAMEQTTYILLSNKPTTSSVKNYLARDPLANDRSAWISLSGPLPQFTSVIKDFSAGTTALQNPPGHSMSVFTAEAIPIDPNRTYSLEMSLKQSAGTEAVTYLAVAWYDAAGRLLVSNVPAPAGAGEPGGWNNGYFSYFGLVASFAPKNWTTYRTSFGRGTLFAVPDAAEYVRVGALLNYKMSPEAVVQLTNIRLREKDPSDRLADGAFPQGARYFVLLPDSRWLFSSASIAGELSGHWPALQLAADFGGNRELRSATLAEGGSPIEPGAYLYILPLPLEHP